MRTLAFLVTVGLCSSAQAAAPADWARTCEAVSHFAEVVAAARDEGQQPDEAILTAQHILAHPGGLIGDVADEIKRQVYATPNLKPGEEGAVFRQKCLTPVQPAAANPQPAALVPIRLNVGVNHIDTVYGVVDVILAWDDDGNGRGHDVFTVVAPGGSVGMPDGNAVTDDPASDQDMRRSVRFARGQVGGEDAVLLLVAQRDHGPGATRTTYETYQLKREASGLRFALHGQVVLPQPYCNADAALSAASNLRLRESYRGPRTPDGCPTG